MAKRKYIFDGVRSECYIRAWKEGRGRLAEINVEVWLSGKIEGSPDGEWVMPAILGLEASIDQSIRNTLS